MPHNRKIKQPNRRAFLLGAFAAAAAGATFIMPPEALSQTNERFITLKCLNTGTTYSGVYKRDSRFLMDEFTKSAGINRTLWDWRQQRSIQIDPKVIDFMYDVAQRCGAGPRPVFNIISGYRTLATIRQLRGVTNSQHRFGKAVDFWIEGIDVAQTAREARAMRQGGVGDYSSRPSFPFVHVDTGNIRNWNRPLHDPCIAADSIKDFCLDQPHKTL